MVLWRRDDALVVVGLQVLAFFFSSKANLIAANNKADISGVSGFRLTSSVVLGFFLIPFYSIIITIN